MISKRILKIVRRYPDCRFSTIKKKMPDVHPQAIQRIIRPLITGGKLERSSHNEKVGFTYRAAKK